MAFGSLRFECVKLVWFVRLSEHNKTQQEIGYAEHPSMDRHCDSVFDRLGRCQEISGQHGAAVGRFGAQHPCGRRGLDIVLPKNAAATGFVGFDFMELLRAISRTQIAGVGFIILVSGGFAEYMKAIGASDRFVTVCAKPLSLIKNPYLIWRQSLSSDTAWDSSLRRQRAWPC